MQKDKSHDEEDQKELIKLYDKKTELQMNSEVRLSKEEDLLFYY